MACVIDQALDIPSAFRHLFVSEEEWLKLATEGGPQGRWPSGAVSSRREAIAVAVPRAVDAELIGIREAARRLRVHENTIRNWLDQGMLQFVRLPGSGYRRLSSIDVADLQATMHLGVADGLIAATVPEANLDQGEYQGGGEQSGRGEGW